MNTACKCTDSLQSQSGIYLRKRWCQLTGSPQVGKRKRKRALQWNPAERLTGINVVHLEPGTHGNMAVCVREQRRASKRIPHDTRSRQPGLGLFYRARMRQWRNATSNLRMHVCVWCELAVKDTKGQIFYSNKYTEDRTTLWTKNTAKKKNRRGERSSHSTVRHRNRGVEVRVWTLDKGSNIKKRFVCFLWLSSPFLQLGRSASKSTLFLPMYLFVPSLFSGQIHCSPHEFTLTLALRIYIYVPYHPPPLTSSLVSVLKDRKCLWGKWIRSCQLPVHGVIPENLFTIIASSQPCFRKWHRRLKHTI